jgi:hypothetical protein
LTREKLAGLFSYDPQNGQFTWLVKRRGIKIGHPFAGYTDRDGYRQIRIDGLIYFSHRLAWLYMTGVYPTLSIDHINGTPGDDRFANLREVSHAVNLQNRTRPTKKNTSGFLGVTRCKNSGKWIPQVQCRGVKSRYLGRYETPEEAHQVYLAEKRRIHAGCTI